MGLLLADFAQYGGVIFEVGVGDALNLSASKTLVIELENPNDFAVLLSLKLKDTHKKHSTFEFTIAANQKLVYEKRLAQIGEVLDLNAIPYVCVYSSKAVQMRLIVKRIFVR